MVSTHFLNTFQKNPIPSKAFVEDKILSLLSRIAMVMIISSPESKFAAFIIFIKLCCNQ